MRAVIAIALIIVCAAKGPAQERSIEEASRLKFDQILDQYVRDGLVYYRALKAERGQLDRYLAYLGGASIDAASRAEQIAFWLNAYNALVLKTVVEHYPIVPHTSAYPMHSIRQIPGAFEQMRHRVAGRTVTLDQIEQTILPGFGDPRVFLAMGRGAVGGGRLRSEAYAADMLDAQLANVAAECASRAQCLAVDTANDLVTMSSIFSWRSQDFIDAYAASAPAAFAARSPIERAVLAFVEPQLLTTERAFLAKNQFRMAFKPFDWTLNDLTGRGGR